MLGEVRRNAASQFETDYVLETMILSLVLYRRGSDGWKISAKKWNPADVLNCLRIGRIPYDPARCR
jgi:hypothetical protein